MVRVYLFCGIGNDCCSRGDKKNFISLFKGGYKMNELKKISTNQEVMDFKRNRERVANNPYRPLYHMSAPDKLIHDANGLCHWQGKYHLFYQYLIERENWIIHWGHACSDDLIHWQDLPVAIKPTIEESCFSGQTLVEENRVIAMYHGTKAGNMIALAEDKYLLEWNKLSDNPVIPMHNRNVPNRIYNSSLPYRIFDPCIWKEDNGYYYSLSGSYKDGEKAIDCTGEVHIFRSPDLSNWEWLGPMFTDTTFAEPGEDMVVPNFWPITEGKHLLLCFSHKRAARGYIGEFDLESARFTPDYHFRFNNGEFGNASIHAPSATIDDKGRYVAIFNMKEARGIKHKNWDGIMSLPRVFSLAEDNTLRTKPVAEIKKLRFNYRKIESPLTLDDNQKILSGIKGKSIEIKAVLESGNAKEMGLRVFQSADNSEYTTIKYSQIDQRLSIDTSQSSLLTEIQPRTPESADLQLAENELLHLNIFIDRSVVEVFTNDRLCLSVRVYPEKEESEYVSFFSYQGISRLISLECWQMHSIWPELEFKEGK